MDSFDSREIYRFRDLHVDIEKFHDGHIAWLIGSSSWAKRFLPKPSFLTFFSRKKLATVSDIRALARLDDTREIGVEKWYLYRDLSEGSLKFYGVKHKFTRRETKVAYNLTALYLKRVAVQTSVGFRKRLIIGGVGYKFGHVFGQLYASVGWVHAPRWLLTRHFKVRLSHKGKSLVLRYPSLSRLTTCAAMIKRARPVSVYSQKGIRYKQETVVKKKGKRKKSA